MKILKQMKKCLMMGSKPINKSSFDRQTKSFHFAFTLVQVFYSAQLFILARGVSSWAKWRQTEAWDALWPLDWYSLIGIPNTVDFVLVFYATSLILAICFSQKRWSRILVFLGLFFYAALHNSFGKVGHYFHAWMYVAFVWIFLPDGPREEVGQSRRLRQIYLSVFLGSQAMILMVYSLSGFWKIWTAVAQTVAGQISAFSVNGFAAKLAERVILTGKTSLLTMVTIENPWFARLLYLTGMSIEFFSLAVVWRWSWHRLWGLALIGMHFGAGMTMGIYYPSNILLLSIMLVCSPFHPKK